MGKNLEYENIDDALALRLVDLRAALGLTIEEAAKRSGVSRATLSRIERGENSPTANTLGHLCAAYNVTMSQLLLDVEDDAPRLISRKQATTWKDNDTGFVRTAISPPARNYDIELVWGEIPAGATVHYDAPPVPGMEQHIVIFEGSLNLKLGDSEYTLRRDDCLRMKLFSTATFHNSGRQTSRYIIAIRSQK